MTLTYSRFPNWLRAVFLFVICLLVSACQPESHNLDTSFSHKASVGITSTAIINKSPQEIIALFGLPALKRSDPPAELWQFQQAECVVDIFFYSASHQPLRAIEVIARLRTGVAADMDFCLSRLIKI